VNTRPFIHRLTACIAATCLFSGCGKDQPTASVLDGKALAAVSCAQCHNVPSPSQLSRDEWPYALAWMGHYLGHPPEVAVNPALIAKHFVPSQPVISRPQLEAIQNYYLDQSPLENPPPVAGPPVSSLFQPLPFAIESKIVSLVAFDPTNQALIVGLSQPAGLLVLQRGVTTPIDVASEPVMFERLGEVARLGIIGHIGHDARQGQIIDFNMKAGTRHLAVDAHPRVAAHRTADIDGDGKPDLLVCGFGDYPTGRVGLWWNEGDHLTEQVLLEEPGTTWGDVADLDGDGDLDVVLMIANNRPRLLAFINQGKRDFEPKTVIDRPVGWGYNRGLIVDWDGDGKPDLVETAGNNLELRGRPIKSNHGVRVLRNEGQWKFREVLFERLDGAIDVVAGDFDGNGRMDLAATAFYPDWRLPVPTTFLLLLRRDDGSVERTGLDDSYWNRWMRIAAGDADGDGDTDILLGAAQVPMAIPAEHMTRYQESLRGKASLLLLRNLKTP
jgi:hypothetical protein